MESLIKEHWGTDRVVVHGTSYYPARLPGFIAMHEEKRVGLITYLMSEGVCEIVTLNSLLPSQGIGTALLAHVENLARRSRCHRLRLVTTNDNLPALRFYQKREFTLASLRPNAVARSRETKPEIPLVGKYGIPIRDELELEKNLHSLQ